MTCNMLCLPPFPLQPFCSGALAELPAVPGGDPHAWAVPQSEREQRRDLTGPEYFVVRCADGMEMQVGAPTVAGTVPQSEQEPRRDLMSPEWPGAGEQVWPDAVKM